jgi:protein phosphatase-4 regulatory subunit 3
LISGCLTTPLRREKLSLVLENDEYLRKLMGVFRMCEDIEDMEGLRHMYAIVKNLFLMNKTQIIEILLQGKYESDILFFIFDESFQSQFVKSENTSKIDISI